MRRSRLIRLEPLFFKLAGSRFQFQFQCILNAIFLRLDSNIESKSPNNTFILHRRNIK